MKKYKLLIIFLLIVYLIIFKMSYTLTLPHVKDDIDDGLPEYKILSE